MVRDFIAARAKPCMKRLILALLSALAVGAAQPAVAAPTPTYGYHVVHAFPHDTGAFTEGLFYLDGYLYESTGLEQHSTLRKEDLATGQVLQQISIAPQYFGEGIVAWGHKLVELTWRSHVGFVYDLSTFEKKGEFHYPGEGWALTHDGHRLIMSDGTSELRFLNPTTLKEEGRLKVTDQGHPVANLNEVEWVKGEVYANIWQTDRIARIDPKTGHVVGWIDLSGILPNDERTPGQTDVLNGIAYDAQHDRLFVTGKMWPKLYEITLVKTGAH